MLHIILAILKIIGILLAAILGLLLLAVLLVLFVPLRYRLEFERKEEKIWAKARFGWLARLILAEAVLIDGKPKVRVRLCGFSKQLIPAPEKKPEKKASRDAPKQQKGGARPQESKEVPKNKAVLKNKAEPEKEADPVKKAGPVKKEDPEKKTDPVKKTEGESGTVSKTVSDPGVQADAEKVLDAGTQAESHIRGFIEKIRVTVLRLWQIIR